MQGRNRDADIEKRLVDREWEEEGNSTDIYTLSCVK